MPEHTVDPNAVISFSRMGFCLERGTSATRCRRANVSKRWLLQCELLIRFAGVAATENFRDCLAMSGVRDVRVNGETFFWFWPHSNVAPFQRRRHREVRALDRGNLNEFSD